MNLLKRGHGFPKYYTWTTTKSRSRDFEIGQSLLLHKLEQKLLDLASQHTEKARRLQRLPRNYSHRRRLDRHDLRQGQQLPVCVQIRYSVYQLPANRLLPSPIPFSPAQAGTGLPACSLLRYLHITTWHTQLC